MLKKTIDFIQPTRLVVIMSDLALLTASIKSTLLEIAKQAQALGVGLQNAAPGEKEGQPNNTVAYLLEIATVLNHIAQRCETLLNSTPDDINNASLK